MTQEEKRGLALLGLIMIFFTGAIVSDAKLVSSPPLIASLAVTWSIWIGAMVNFTMQGQPSRRRLNAKVKDGRHDTRQ